MRTAALGFGLARMMAVAFAAAAGDLAALAPRIVGRRLPDLKRGLGVLVRGARSALPNARRCLGRRRHASLPVLLQTLMGRVLCGVALLALLFGIDAMRLFSPGFMRIAGPGIAGPLVALVLPGNRGWFRHVETPMSFSGINACRREWLPRPRDADRGNCRSSEKLRGCDGRRRKKTCPVRRDDNGAG